VHGWREQCGFFSFSQQLFHGGLFFLGNQNDLSPFDQERLPDLFLTFWHIKSATSNQQQQTATKKTQITKPTALDLD
jgi:hypothetical protein